MNNRGRLFSRTVAFVAILAAGGGLVFDAMASWSEITPNPWYRHYDRYNYGTEYHYGRILDYDSLYNIRMGRLSLGLTGRLAAQYSDNISYEDDDGETDSSFSFVPELSLSGVYALSPGFALSGGVSMGYRYYTNDAGNSDFFLTSDAGADAGGTVFLGDTPVQVSANRGGTAAGVGGAIRLDEDSIIWIHDRLSRESDTFELWDREGRGSEYAAWRNTLEASYSQQLHPDWSGQAVYAHENKWVEDSEYDYENFVSDEIDANVLWAATPKLRLGPYGRYEWLRFEEDSSDDGAGPGRNDRTIAELGLTAIYQVANSLTLNANVGYEFPDIDTSHNPAADDEEEGVTANLTLAFNPAVWPGHRVRASYRRNHEAPSRTDVNYADELLLGYGIDFHLTRDWLASADIDFMNVDESDEGDRYNLLRLWLRTSYWLTPKTILSASYMHSEKFCDVDVREYSENFFEIAVTHHF